MRISSGGRSIAAMVPPTLPPPPLKRVRGPAGTTSTIRLSRLPDVTVAWRDVWLGALLTALFFEVGKAAIGFYIGNQGLESTYGAAASIVVVLIWVYYTSQIILMGAEITHAYAKHGGSLKQQTSPAIDQREANAAAGRHVSKQSKAAVSSRLKKALSQCPARGRGDHGIGRASAGAPR